MDFTEQSPVILSLCPGMLGLERGFERACKQLNWQQPTTAAYVEIEAFICYNLVKQMEQGVLAPTPIYTNIKTFNAKPFCGKIHGIFGGYPCQPFSVSGSRKGEYDERHLWPFISGIIEAAQPFFCFFENVVGHITMGFDEVYRSLSNLGYRVEAGIYTAEEVGAPHERERLYILALANTNYPRSQGVGEFRISAPGPEGMSWQARSKTFPNDKSGPQFDWERPALKSMLDFTINGYDYRSDLLRMAGNGVVEQTAEIAFIDLLKKFK